MTFHLSFTYGALLYIISFTAKGWVILKPGKTGLKRIFDATGYSIKGLKAAWKHEAAFRQETLLFFILSLIAILLPIASQERILLISSLFLVIIIELVNSAIEAVVDRVGDEWHELSGRAKDIASAAVFIALLHAAYVWISILIQFI